MFNQSSVKRINTQDVQGPKLWGILILAATAKLLLHLLSMGNYGYNNDELYAIAMSNHLSWGYVDLPPLVPALIALSRLVFGQSLLAMHVIPALTGAVTVILAGLLVREMGGKVFAVSLTCLVAVTSPTWLAFNTFFGYDGFDQLVLMLFLWVLVKYLRTRNPKLWLLLGAAAGVCLLTKATLLFYGPGILLALLLCGHGRDFRTRWPYLALAIMALMQVPTLLWQVSNGFPTLDYWFSYKDSGTHHMGPVTYLLTMIFIMNPLLLPLSIAGAVSMVKKRRQQSLEKFFGIVMLTSLLLIYLLNGKNTMLAVLFLPFYAFGALYLEDRLAQKRRVRAALTAYLTAASLLFVPLALPLLPADTFMALTGQFMQKTIQLDNNEQGELPAHFASCMGWDNLAKTVCNVYKSLPQEDQRRCALFALDYDQAGAIDLFGPQNGVGRKAISGRLTYWLWGYGDFNGDVMLSVGLDEDYLKSIFDSVEVGGTIQSRYAMPQDTNLPVYICRGLKLDVPVFWEQIKNY